MRRRWIRSPLPLALAVTLVSIAVGLVIALVVDAAGGDDVLAPTAAEVMLTVLQLATVELFVLWGVFALVKRQRAKSTTTTP